MLRGEVVFTLLHVVASLPSKLDQDLDAACSLFRIKFWCAFKYTIATPCEFCWHLKWCQRREY